MAQLSHHAHDQAGASGTADLHRGSEAPPLLLDGVLLLHVLKACLAQAPMARPASSLQKQAHEALGGFLHSGAPQQQPFKPALCHASPKPSNIPSP